MPTKGRRAVITGIGGGIGATLMRILLEDGYKIIGLDVEETPVIRDLRKNGEIDFKCCDLSDPDSVNTAADYLNENYGAIDVLINNAGVNKIRKFEEIPVEEWDFVLNVNLRGTFLMCQKLLPLLRRGTEPCIVNVASLAGKIGGAIVGVHYSVAKGGVISLTRVLAQPLAREGIRINVICPGPTDTPFHDHTPPETRQRIASNIPLGRFARPNEVAQVIRFLASPDSSFVTGEVIDVTGGLYID